MRASWYPKPRFETKFKVRWDDTKLYVGAYVQDKDLWGTVNISDTAGMVILCRFKTQIFSFKTIPENLDPSYKTDTCKGFRGCFETEIRIFFSSKTMKSI